jgi:AmiR/NasT family two-component response regulator
MEVDRRRIADLERQVATLGEAVQHRTSIGIALGMIMERLELDHEHAFAYLRTCSQAQNRKIYDLAVEMVETREMPGSQGTLGA